MTTLIATAATNGDPTASMPRMLSETPHRIDNVEACRTTPDGVCCAIETSSIKGRIGILRRESILKKYRSATTELHDSILGSVKPRSSGRGYQRLGSQDTGGSLLLLMARCRFSRC